MKRTLYTIILSAVSTALIIFFLSWLSSLKKEDVYIAVAGPLSGPDESCGKAMIKGVQLYLDQINESGGIAGRDVKLLVFDDKNVDKQAVEVASEIIKDEKILLVIGHFDSSASIAAGRIYGKNDIPVITASAGATSVTLGNEWYFRVQPGDRFQGKFIAHYINGTFKKKSACIIFSKSQYGSDLANDFEKAARDLKVHIQKKWGFDLDGKNSDNELAKIASELRAMKAPGIIFMATEPEEAVKIISSLKYPGSNYAIIGPERFTEERFIEGFEKYPRERAKPGYYSDNIYSVSPFLMEIANEKAFEFEQDFMEKYKESPSRISACYYDAAMVAVEALKGVGKGHENEVRRIRKKIRSSLASLSVIENALRGVTGYIYFDRNGDVRKPLSVGVYKRQKLIPLFSQYQMKIGPATDTEDTLKKILNGEIIRIEGDLMNRTDVVYTGIDINEISNLAVRNAFYTMDFYVWFRYKGDFDVTRIKFMNSVGAVKLGPPIVDKKIGDITVRTYHVKADFKGDFDFHAYPFEDHTLDIRFRHESRTRERLIYVGDTSESKRDAEKIYLSPVSGWQVKETFFFQNNITHSSGLGIPGSQNVINYSQFNSAVRIERQGVGAVFKNFLPIVVMVCVLYLIYFIPYEQNGYRTLIIVVVFIANVFYHIEFLSVIRVEYWTIIEYAFFMVYLLILTGIFVSILTFVLHKRGAGEKIKWVGKMVHPVMVLAGALAIVFTHHNF